MVAYLTTSFHLASQPRLLPSAATPSIRRRTDMAQRRSRDRDEDDELHAIDLPNNAYARSDSVK